MNYTPSSNFPKSSMKASKSRAFTSGTRHYRQQGKFLLREFVIMPDHFHILITPTESLEPALQLIKGGFSYRARKELGFVGEIWQSSYHDRRVRDVEEYRAFREYIHMNPVKRNMVSDPAEYIYSSAHRRFQLDGLPPRLKVTVESLV